MLTTERLFNRFSTIIGATSWCFWSMSLVRKTFAATIVSVCVLALLATSSMCKEEKAFRDIKMTPERDEVSESAGALRVDAAEVAELLNIAPMVERLRQLQKEAPTDSTHRSRNVQSMRLLCLWKIFIAEQEVRKAVAQIDYDTGVAFQSLHKLEARQNSIINDINQINFMQSGVLGVIKNSISFKGRHNNPVAAQEIAMTAFGTSMALSLTNMLIVPRFMNQRVDSKPNMLSFILNSERKPSDLAQSYLWKFFNKPIPRSSVTLTRREILIKHWEDFDGLRSSDVKNNNVLASMSPDERILKENIRAVNQRIDLLQDMKTHIEEFDTSLFELHQTITLK